MTDFMKLHTYKPADISKVQGWLIQKKEDGVFCAATVEAGQWVLYSRTGRRLYTPKQCQHLTAHLPPAKSKHPQWFIGELINPSCSLEQLSGLVNPNRTTQWSDAEFVVMQDACIVWHDCLDLQDGVDNTGYAQRYTKLQLYTSYIAPCIPWQGEEEFNNVYNSAVQLGWEGIVIKDPAGGYTMGKRSKAQLKYVRQYSEDLECVGVVMGKGKREGMIGALEFAFNGTTFTADLGAGWTDTRRDWLTQEWLRGNHASVLGLWEVQGLQPSSTGKAIRLPKAVRRRYDKE